MCVYLPAVLIGMVVDVSDVTVRLEEGIMSMDNIAIAAFRLALDILGVVIVHAVLEFVSGMSLK